MSLAHFILAGLSAAAVGPKDYDVMAKEAQRLLSELVSADTSNPPGNEARAVALGAERLKAAGIPFEVTEFAPGRENLVARLKGSGPEKPLLLLAHVDVVGASGQTWSTPPHQVTEREGFLYGRGVNDDLGMASINLEVFLALAQAKTPLRRDVIFAWTGDEESGGSGIRWLLAHRRSSIDAAIALNEGGGPMLGEDGRVSLLDLQEAEKAYQDFTVSTSGTTGHSSVPLEDNAIYRLSEALARLGHFRFPARLLPVTRAYFEARAKVEPPRLAQAIQTLLDAKGPLPEAALKTLDEDPVLASNLRTTCVATLVKGGTRVNALPADATANVNCRILPDETVAEVKKQLEAVIGDSKVSVQAVSEFGRAGESPVQGEVPAAIAAIAADLWPGTQVTPFMSRGATDSRYLRQAGIASYGFDPIAVTEADGRRAHGIDERIPLASFRTGVGVMERLVRKLAAKP